MKVRRGSETDHALDRRDLHILALRDKGMTQPAIAAAVGVSERTVYGLFKEAPRGDKTDGGAR